MVSCWAQVSGSLGGVWCEVQIHAFDQDQFLAEYEQHRTQGDEWCRLESATAVEQPATMRPHHHLLSAHTTSYTGTAAFLVRMIDGYQRQQSNCTVLGMYRVCSSSPSCQVVASVVCGLWQKPCLLLRTVRSTVIAPWNLGLGLSTRLSG